VTPGELGSVPRGSRITDGSVDLYGVPSEWDSGVGVVGVSWASIKLPGLA
jgi:hypothetical protein